MTRKTPMSGSFHVHTCDHCELIHFTVLNVRKEIELSFGMDDTDACQLAKNIQNLLYERAASK